jgi:polyisoprenoid-binding protein YceI
MRDRGTTVKTSLTETGAIMMITIKSFVLAAVLIFAGVTARAADSFTVDPVHSSVTFMISHQGISQIHGRFNQFSGQFMIDRDDPSKSSFAFSIPVESVDTNNPKRDEHLRAPDYFNAKQFPNMTFQSTKVKPIDGGYEVTGDLTLHGVKKEMSLELKGGNKLVEFPKGMHRIGITTDTSIKRSDFGMRAELPVSLGDDVRIIMGIEATKN